MTDIIRENQKAQARIDATIAEIGELLERLAALTAAGIQSAAASEAAAGRAELEAAQRADRERAYRHTHPEKRKAGE